VLNLNRRSLVIGAAVMPFAARAQNWPSGLVRIVVPFPAGGSVDAIARLVQPLLQQKLGTTVLIENRAGGSGSIGAASVAKSIPDSYTWLFVSGTHAVNPGSKSRTGSGRSSMNRCGFGALSAQKRDQGRHLSVAGFIQCQKWMWLTPYA
jgi:tripartite-type tricarboxylate transporter receptor subunit TctC